MEYVFPVFSSDPNSLPLSLLMCVCMVYDFFLMMGIHRGHLDCSSHVPISASIRLEMSDEGLMPKSWRLANTDTCVDVM